MPPAPDLVLVDVQDHVQTITLNREEKRNALNDEVAGRIAEALRQGQDDPRVRVIVLTGAGDKAFCAGATSLRTRPTPPSRSTPPTPRTRSSPSSRPSSRRPNRRSPASTATPSQAAWA